MSDLSIFLVTGTCYNGVQEESTPLIFERYVAAETFADAIPKVEALKPAPYPETHFLDSIHAEWKPDLEDIIQ
jgi:hypothetical protein